MSDGGAPPESKPDAKPDTQHINIRVVSQDGNEVHFKIKRNTALRKLMQAYCDRQSVELKAVRFLLDGTRILENQTPEELEMENDDMIDAMMEQVGGRAADP